jgi:uncharacterized protein (TIGR00730 family)
VAPASVNGDCFEAAPVDEKLIGVFGGRHPVPGDAEYAEAARLGSLLAGAGFGVISGGYSGVMEAVSRGASEAGGTAVGVTMEIFGSLAPNPFLTREIRTRNFFERLETLSTSADGFIAVRGGMGTLAEISLVWNMLQTRTLGPKPLILLGSFWKRTLRSIAEQLTISQSDLDLLAYAATPEEAVAHLEAYSGSAFKG